MRLEAFVEHPAGVWLAARCHGGRMRTPRRRCGGHVEQVIWMPCKTAARLSEGETALGQEDLLVFPELRVFSLK